MKSVIMYSSLFVGSAVLAILLVYGVYMIKPEYFTTQQPTNASVSPVPQTQDSLKALDSTLVKVEPAADTVVVLHRTIAILRDSLKVLAQQLDRDRERTQQLTLQSSPAREKADSTTQFDPKTMARMLETMEPEQVVRVLDNLSDEEARAIVKNMNKRYVGRILSAVDPARVTQLIR
jgi:predicted metal-dependent hydrolase